MSRQNISSGAPWETQVGYSRAVKIGNQVEVSGCVSIKDGYLYGKGDPYLQAKRSLEIVLQALAEAGAQPTDVIRTRMYVTDIENQWQDIGRAHAEVFQDIKPATSMVEVAKLIDPDYLLEIEATAIIHS